MNAIAQRFRRAAMLVRGLGATPSQDTAVIGTAAGGTVASLTPILFGAAAGPVGLVIGGAISLAASILGVMGVGNGCGETCVAASNTANQVETQLRANLAAYRAGQVSQSQALANFDALWNQLAQICSNPSLATAGKHCIEDRQQGACHYQANGQCWNWFIGYRDPIQNEAPPAGAPVVGGLSAAELLGLALLGVVAVEAL